MPTIGADEPGGRGGAADFVPLTTTRLRLRPFAPDDALPVQRFLGNEELAKQTVNLPYPFEIKESQDWIRSTIDDLTSGNGVTLALERLYNGALIGAVSLQITPEVPSRAELGYWVARTYWGNGFATEAVKRLIDYGRNNFGFNEIWASVFSENVGSQRVLEKSGFRELFTRQEDCPARGGERSITYYDLSSDE